MVDRNLEFYLKIKADLKNALSALEKMEAAEKGVSDKAKTVKKDTEDAGGGINKMASSTKDFIKAIAGAAIVWKTYRLITGEVHNLIDAQLEYQQMHFSLLAASGDAQKAGQEFAWVSEVAQKLGVDLRAAASGYSQLSAAAKGTSIRTRTLHEVFEATASAATVLHWSAQQTNSVLLALQQMISKGRVQSQELVLQLGQSVPGALSIASRAMGVTTKDLVKMVESGQLATEDFLPKFAKELKATFGGKALQEATQALNAQLNRMHTSIFRLRVALSSGEFSKTMGSAAKAVADVANAFTDLVSNSGDANGKLKDVKGTASAAVGPLESVASGIKGIATAAVAVWATFAVAGQKMGQFIEKTGHVFKSGLHENIKSPLGFDAALSGVLGTQGKEGQKLQKRMERDAKARKDLATANAADIQSIWDKAGELINKIWHPVMDTARDDTNGLGDDTDKTMKKVKELTDEQKRQAKTVQQIIEALQAENATVGQNQKGQLDYKLAINNASQAQRDQAQALFDSIQKKKAALANDNWVNAQLHKLRQDLIKERVEQQKADAKAVESIKDMIDPSREVHRQIDQVIRLWGQGKLTIEEAQKAVDILEKKLKANQDEVSQYAIQAARNIQSAFADFLFDPFDRGLKGLLTGFLDVIRRMVSEALAAQLAKKLFGDIGSSGSGSGGNLGGLFGAMLQAFVHHEGGPAGVGPTRAVPAWAFALAPRYHSGGIVPGLAPDEVPAILQTGEVVQSRAQVAAAANQGGRIRIVNVPDKNLAADYLDSADGEKTILNVIRRNHRAVQHIMQGG